MAGEDWGGSSQLVNFKATLDSVELPMQFSYQVPVPVRRVTVQRTMNGTVRQIYSSFVPSDSMVAWRCPDSSPLEFKFFSSKFVEADTTWDFVGYWGEEMTVKFHSLDPPRVRSQLFDLSGSFQIQTVTNWHQIPGTYAGDPC